MHPLYTHYTRIAAAEAAVPLSEPLFSLPVTVNDRVFDLVYRNGEDPTDVAKV
jgi:hypothetical protein